MKQKDAVLDAFHAYLYPESCTRCDGIGYELGNKLVKGLTKLERVEYHQMVEAFESGKRLRI